ncbi:Eco47II family restriction endonuclease [Synechococcus sp. PCC 6716]|nr:Eco47II family restriction endonuclease [Synechococcus sp. PCC 6716]
MNKSGDYQLGFISNQDIYNHVKQTISRYRLSINFKEFTKLKIDPIKASFDGSIVRVMLNQ